MTEEERPGVPDSTGETQAGGKETFHRRGFFVEGFRSLLKPLAHVVEKRLEHVGLPDWDEYKRTHGRPAPRDGASPPPRAALPDRPVLRPPGALEEEDFLQTCMSSGQCIAACPVRAIKWSMDTDPSRDAKPFIDPQDQACVVCDDLSCMKACPSGALVPVERSAIHMGLAAVDERLCVRTQGEDCQICVDKCPLGSQAIEIPYYGAPVEVRDPGCVGCGVCEMYCPTSPRAILVRPLDQDGREAPPGGDGPLPGESYLPVD